MYLLFAAMGDMLAHDSVVTQAKVADGSYDFKPYFSAIRPLYTEADAVFCNAEGLTVGKEFGISGYPSFNAPTEFAHDLTAGAGCNVINLANNHINDKGQAAIDANNAVWEELKPLAFAGANRTPEEQMTVRYFTKNGVTVAFLAFADYSNNENYTPYGLNIYHNTDLVERLLGRARANADAVIVSAHWGTENSNAVNPDQTAAAQLFADNGADVVIGTGPHVIQKATYVTAADGRKTFVWYSIGNMLSSQLQVNELTGIIAGFTLKKQPQGGLIVEQPTAQITYMSYDWSTGDRAAQRLNTRSNLQLRSLSQSGTAVRDMFGQEYSASERETYVKTTLGSDTGVEVKP
ncbi:CapA family protein [Candidatus Saccharibacteria bacterium]|nr:MAG: CapA family protein [Candidatus Saccharibacteria bacterium]